MKRQAFVVVALAALCYGLIAGGQPTGDDWGSVRIIGAWATQGASLSHILAPYEAHWSPLFVAGSWLAVVLDPSHMGLYAVRAFNALALALSLAAVLKLTELLRLSRFAQGAALLMLTFHQAAIGTAYQWDSIGPMWGEALARWAVVLAVAHLVTRGRQSWPRVVAIAALVLAGLMGKETVLGTTAGLGLVMGAALADDLLARRRGEDPGPYPWATAFAVIVAVFGFVALRQVAGGATGLGESRYNLAGPKQWIVNAVQLGGALLSPVSTLDLWQAYRSSAVEGSLVARGIVAVALGLGGLWAWWKLERPWWLKIGVALACLGAFYPMGWMRHVSELYLPSALLWWSLLVALLADCERGQKLVRGAVALAVVMHLWAWWGKLEVLKHHGAMDRDGASACWTALATQERDITSLRIDDRRPQPPYPYSIYWASFPHTALEARAVFEGVAIEVNRRPVAWTCVLTEEGATIERRP